MKSYSQTNTLDAPELLRTRPELAEAQLTIVRKGTKWTPERKKLHSSWWNAWDRCTNPDTAGFANYGGRGISVCRRWADFNTFCADMGPRPLGMTLERKDVHGGYSPENCCWATPKAQARNRTNSRRYDYLGESLTLPEWAEKFSLDADMVTKRVRQLGWSVERALTAPRDARGRRPRANAKPDDGSAS